MHKILIADDEPFIIEGIKHLIDWEEYGMIISATAKDGAEALKIFETTDIDIVITDIKMPKMNGIELIRKIKEKNLHTCFIVLSGYDDFEYLKQSIQLGIENYLLKPVNQEEFKETLIKTAKNLESFKLYKYSSKDIHVLRNNILYRWLTDCISEEELLERSKLLDFQIYTPPYYICIMRIFFDTVVLQQHLLDQAIYDIEKICNEKINGRLNALSFCTHENEIVFIICKNEISMDISFIKSILQECVSDIKYKFGINTFTAIGNFIDCESKLYQGFTQAKDLLQYSMIMPYNSIIDYSEIENNKESTQFKKFVSPKIINKLVAEKNVQGFLHYIDDIFLSLSAFQGVTPNLAHSIAAEILFSLINSQDISTTSKNNLPDFFAYPLSSLNKTASLEETMKIVKGTVSCIMEFIINQENQMNPIVKRVLNYVNLNYFKDISIRSIACQININPNYLGQIFKEETGEFFTDYINKVRINKVKELLKTNKAVKEICSSVGYTETNYFYKVFKKYTGISPTEYRNQVYK